jgi:hypothetical protein
MQLANVLPDATVACMLMHLHCCAAWAAGAKELLSQASSSLGVQQEHWVQASSLQQLQQAVRSIRQQQMELTPELRLVSAHDHAVVSVANVAAVLFETNICVGVQLGRLLSDEWG